MLKPLECPADTGIIQSMHDAYNPARDLGAVVYRLPLAAGVRIGVEKVSRERWRPDFRIRGGSRPNWPLLLFRSGRLRLRYDDGDWQAVGPGQLCILAPGREQELLQTDTGGVSCFRVSLAGPDVPRLLRRHLGADHGLWPAPTAALEQVAAMLRLLGSVGEAPPVPDLLLAHVQVLLRYCAAAGSPGWSAAAEHGATLRAALAGSCFRHDPVQAAAAACGVSQAHFSRRYRRLCGESPSGTVARLRCQEAQELLGDPAIGLSAIAQQLGYADVFSFSKAFRRWTGMAPSQWRQDHASA
ncbi:MAG: AraC family transcriptional regulator [Planctomycetota bacterium]